MSRISSATIFFFLQERIRLMSQLSLNPTVDILSWKFLMHHNYYSSSCLLKSAFTCHHRWYIPDLNYYSCMDEFQGSCETNFFYFWRLRLLAVVYACTVTAFSQGMQHALSVYSITLTFLVIIQIIVIYLELRVSLSSIVSLKSLSTAQPI